MVRYGRTNQQTNDIITHTYRTVCAKQEALDDDDWGLLRVVHWPGGSHLSSIVGIVGNIDTKAPIKKE